MTSLNIFTEDTFPSGLEAIVRGIERRRLQDEGRRAADHDGDGDGGGPTVDWTWRHLAGILAVLAFTFTLGANWHRVDAQREAYELHVGQNEREHERFAHKDVVDSKFDAMKQQLDRIEKALERRRPQ